MLHNNAASDHDTDTITTTTSTTSTTSIQSSSSTYTLLPASPTARTHKAMAQESRYQMLLLALLVLLLELSTAAPALQQQQQEPEARGARLLDRFNHRYPDGSYEFRYELDDGTARYERGYFAFINEVKTLMVVGYYSYRMPDGRYITVFYNADQFGYRQNQSITPEVYPNLPRSIEVPALKESTAVRQKATPQPSAQTQPHSLQFREPGTTSNYVSSTTSRASVLATRRGRY
ncbi:endocuticle structural glycoprotein SgAbd-2 [Drosophila virilis]|uniref:endocuticle structural glycoprotein SgAbd-2 n=1 Tax=Drosophila virilis TaxID=7244 RepID=UPI0038B371F3